MQWTTMATAAAKTHAANAVSQKLGSSADGRTAPIRAVPIYRALRENSRVQPISCGPAAQGLSVMQRICACLALTSGTPIPPRFFIRFSTFC
jgi:hypothetical protein